MKLLDTDTCIAILRGHETVIQLYGEAPEELATTWITAAELYYGAAKSSAPESARVSVRNLLQTLTVLGLDDRSAEIFGAAKALLERQGQRLADADLFIGAVAVAHGAIIVTGNRRHFERFPSVRIEDWIRP